MKNVILLFAVLTVLGILVANVQSTSPRKCPDKCDPCDSVSCSCGTYKDECDCCDVCMKCKDESCSILEGNVCEEGYTCGDPNRDYLEQLHSPATCIRALSAPEL